MTLVQEVVAFEKYDCDEVAIHFIGKVMCRLHARFFNDPTVTDCISFPMDCHNQQGYRYLGDVFVCPAVALDYARKNHGDPQFRFLSIFCMGCCI